MIGKNAVVEIAGESYKGQVINFGLHNSAKDNKTEQRYFVNIEFSIPSRAAYVGQSATIKLQ